MSFSPASSEAYLTLPVVLDNPAWMRAVYLENPMRVAEMSQRLATVVQAAWQELKQQPQASALSFGVYTKRHTGRDRADAGLGDELHADAGLGIDLFQIVDQLGKVFDRVNVVMRWWRNQAYAWY